MKIYHEIDPTTKLFVTDVFYEEQKDDKGVVTNPVTANMIPDDVPSGLFHPKWDGKAWVEGNTTEGVKMASRISYAARNTKTLEAIAKLEQSIDTSRMRREVFEGMRKQAAGVSPTAAELWSIAKVQDVDNQIGVLRAKLK